jgi:hypothetical protein
MSLSFDEICAEAMALPNGAKASLVEKLVASMEAKISPELERFHLDQAKRRRDEIRQGKVDSVPGQVALEMARSVLKK